MASHHLNLLLPIKLFSKSLTNMYMYMYMSYSVTDNKLHSMNCTWKNLITPLEILHEEPAPHVNGSPIPFKNTIFGLGRPSATHVRLTTSTFSRQPRDAVKFNTIAGPVW